MAAMRSVSLTRQLAMCAKVVVPWAYSAIPASVMAASGIWLRVQVDGPSGPSAALDLYNQLGPLVICAPMAGLLRQSGCLPGWNHSYTKI